MASCKFKKNKSFDDYGFHDIPPQIRETLNKNASVNLFNSIGFGELYFQAQRVCIWGSNDSREGIRSYCYREERRLGFLKILEIFGPMHLTSSEIKDLMVLRKAQIVLIRFMEKEDVSSFSSPWYRCTKVNPKEDVVIELPDNVEDYLRSLGDKTRKHLPYFVRRVKREWGDSFHVTYDLDKSISEDTFSELVLLNRARMESKGKVHLWTKDSIKRRWALVQSGGLLCSIRFNNTLVGGTMSYFYKDEAYLDLIGHDPRHNTLNLGSVSMWLTIEHLITLGIKRYHLLWGDNFYKYQFGGNKHELFQIIVFRNPFIEFIWGVLDYMEPRINRVRRAMARRVALKI